MNHDELAQIQLKPAPATLEGLAARTHFEATASLMANLAGLLAIDPHAAICLEFLAATGSITLIATTLRDWEADVTGYLYAAYPAAGLGTLDHLEAPAASQPATATVQFSPHDGTLRQPDFAGGDPLATLLEVLASVPEDATLRVRLILATTATKPSLALRAVGGLNDFLLGSTRQLLLGSTPDAKPPAPESEPPKKADTAPLRANLALIATAATAAAAETLVRRAAGAYHSFAVTGDSKTRYQLGTRAAARSALAEPIRPDPKTAFLLTPAEAAGLFHPPLTPRAFPRLATLTATQLPIPAALSEEGITIGYGAHRDHQPPIHLSPEDRLRHTYIIGATGTGKSTLLKTAILQDMENGDGCCFIDPHGEEIDWLLERIPPHRARDVILFDPADPAAVLGLNLLEWRTPDERDLIIQELIALFYKLFDPNHTGIIGPQFEHWLRSAALTITEPAVRGTLLDIPRLFTDAKFQQDTVAHTVHPAARDFWLGQMATTADFHKSEMLNYFTSKFGGFLGNTVMAEILSAKSSAFDLRTIMDRRKILLVNLSKGRLGSLNAQLLGTLIVTKLQLAALSRADVSADQRPPFYVYIDEFQNIVTDSFASMLSEIRKYGVALHLAHQYSDQLPEPIKQAVAGNVGTLAAFRLGATDAHWLAPHFAPLTEADLVGIAPYHFHLRTLAAGQLTTPFTVASPQLVTTPKPERAEAIRGRVREFVATTRQPAL